LRPGHNSSSSPEEGFEPTIDVQVSLMTVQESQLVDQHRSQSETLGVDPTLGGNLPVRLEDGLEMLIVKFSLAMLRKLWKMRLTSTPSSVCG
jgi:hypothetical protein